ncbi:MAG: TRAP transporter substrate-binding protein [Brooklawnia sp.]|jgi:tripartite ATP-independent transporter DctP family solute receptor
MALNSHSRMKKIKGALLAGTLLAGALLTACSSGDSGADSSGGTSDAAVESLALKVAFNQDATHPQAVAIEKFGEDLEEATDGRYSIDLYTDELLGAQAETIEMVQAGSVEMAFIIGSLMENFNPDYAVLSLPYMYESSDHMMSALNDMDVVGDLYSSTSADGIQVLRTFYAGQRNLYTTKEIKEPADMAGLKLRVPGSQLGIDIINAMGGSGTPMAFGEVYTAIQSGVIDGAENNEVPYADMGHSEVAQFYNYTQHQIIPDILIINPAVLEAMSEEDRETFQTLLDEAVAYEYSLYAEKIEESIVKSKDVGATFNTDVDQDAFKELLAPVRESYLTTDSARTLYEAIVAAA